MSRKLGVAGKLGSKLNCYQLQPLIYSHTSPYREFYNTDTSLLRTTESLGQKESKIHKILTSVMRTPPYSRRILSCVPLVPFALFSHGSHLICTQLNKKVMNEFVLLTPE